MVLFEPVLALFCKILVKYLPFYYQRVPLPPPRRPCPLALFQGRARPLLLLVLMRLSKEAETYNRARTNPSFFFFLFFFFWNSFVPTHIRSFSYRGKGRGRPYHSKAPIVDYRVSSEV